MNSYLQWMLNEIRLETEGGTPDLFVFERGKENECKIQLNSLGYMLHEWFTLFGQELFAR